MLVIVYDLISLKCRIYFGYSVGFILVNVYDLVLLYGKGNIGYAV